MTPREREVYRMLRKPCREGRRTPRHRAIADKIGCTERIVGKAIAGLRKSGLLRAVYDNGNGIDQFGMEFEGEWRWTKSRSAERKERRETPFRVAFEYGATPIAIMDPDKREAEIARIYDNRKYNLNGFRPGEFKEAYAAKRAAE